MDRRDPAMPTVEGLYSAMGGALGEAHEVHLVGSEVSEEQNNHDTDKDSSGSCSGWSAPEGVGGDSLDYGSSAEGDESTWSEEDEDDSEWLNSSDSSESDGYDALFLGGEELDSDEQTQTPVEVAERQQDADELEAFRFFVAEKMLKHAHEHAYTHARKPLNRLELKNQAEEEEMRRFLVTLAHTEEDIHVDAPPPRLAEFDPFWGPSRHRHRNPDAATMAPDDGSDRKTFSSASSCDSDSTFEARYPPQSETRLTAALLKRLSSPGGQLYGGCHGQREDQDSHFFPAPPHQFRIDAVEYLAAQTLRRLQADSED